MPEALVLDMVPRRACAGCVRLCPVGEIGRRSGLCRTCRGTCASCKRVVGVPQLSRTARCCERCTESGAVHLGRAIDRGATVHPMLPFAEDAAAQAFVEQHPGGATLEVCGDALGVTRERLRQIESKALKRLRKRCRLAGITAEDLVAVLANRGRSGEHMTPSTGFASGYMGASLSEAKTASVQAHSTLPEEFYSPEGEQFAAAVEDLERHARRLDAVFEEARRRG